MILWLRVWARLLALLQSRCQHRGYWVLADVTEGGCRGLTQVRWCRACGAVAVACCDGDTPRLRRPDPVLMVSEARRLLNDGRDGR